MGMKRLGKALAAALAFWLALALSGWAGPALARRVESSPRLLALYASGGEFEQNPYFSEESQARFGVPLDLLSPLGLAPPVSQAELCRRYAQRAEEMAYLLCQNQPYLDYLRGEGTGLAGLAEYCQRVAQLPDNLTYACRYLLFLLWVLFLHLLLRNRPALYFGMGLLCLLATGFKLSGNLLAAALLGSPAALHGVAEGAVPPLLEAMLTFLIFDITLLSLEQSRLGRKLAPLYRDLPALQTLVATLSAAPAAPALYRSRVERSLPHFAAYAKQNRSRRAKALRLQRAVEALAGPHTNQSFIRDLVRLQTLLPNR